MDFTFPLSAKCKKWAAVCICTNIIFYYFHLYLYLCETIQHDINQIYSLIIKSSICVTSYVTLSPPCRPQCYSTYKVIWTVELPFFIGIMMTTALMIFIITEIQLQFQLLLFFWHRLVIFNIELSYSISFLIVIILFWLDWPHVCLHWGQTEGHVCSYQRLTARPSNSESGFGFFGEKNPKW